MIMNKNSHQSTVAQTRRVKPPSSPLRVVYYPAAMRIKLTLLFLAAATAVAQAPTVWTPELTMQTRTIAEVVPSPDGARVAWAQTEAVMEPERSEMVTQIFVAGADGSQRRQLTRGEQSATNPSFSPDGRYVYFASERTGKRNVYRIAIAGGEAEILTDFKGNLGTYRVSPDGKTVAFTGHEPPADEEKNKKQKSDWRVIDANPANMALYLIPAEADADGKRPQRKLTDGKRHVDAFDWAPDSRALAFSHQPTPLADDFTKTDIAEVEVTTGSVKPIAATAAAEQQPKYSPDGKYLALVRSADPVQWAGESRIVLFTRATGEARTLPATNDEQPELMGWSADSRLLFREALRTRAAISAIPPDWPAIT